jgi:CubicO group peptidase (beta-lactamase class C family)
LFGRAFGFADRDARRPNTIETAFELASVSKMFTAVVVAQLAEQNKLRFDATIGALLPGYPAGQASSRVTVHHLLTMSSGIPDLFRSSEFWAGLGGVRTLADYWKFFAPAPLEFPPGTQWAYSNSNYLVLGSIVERTVGGSFAEAVEARVFRPVGMTRLARGYTRVRPGSKPGAPPDPDRWYPAWEEGAADNGSVVGVPMGGGVSTAHDLAKFAGALMQGHLLSREMTERIMTGHVPTEYGGRHGHGLETRLLNGVRILGHRGGFTGISNQIDFYPDLGYVLVVLGNTDADGTQEIANRVRTLITGFSLP